MELQSGAKVWDLLVNPPGFVPVVALQTKFLLLSEFWKNLRSMPTMSIHVLSMSRWAVLW